MAQHLKHEVRQRIAEAALAVFARRGFQATTMAEIGREARVSTGNIYRYYENKETLFDALLPDAFVARFMRLTRRRVDSLEGVDDYRRLPPSDSFHVVSRKLVAFCIENRLRVVILLDRCQGTRLAGFAEQMIQRLVKLAIAHFRGLRPGLRVSRTMRFELEQIYRNLVRAVVRIFEQFEDGCQIEEAVEAYSRYHLAGLKGLFQ